MLFISNHLFLKFAALTVIFVALVGAGWAQCDGDAAGPNPAAIQGAVDAFRAHLGPNNGVGGSFTSGRREINWDTVPESLTEPHSLTPDFFNFNSRRGAIFTTAAAPDPDDPFLQPVAVSSGPATGVPLRFGNINPQYTNEFQSFSAPRLFTAPGSNILEIRFFIPGTSIPASVSGFGAVFSDVDTPVTQVLLYDETDRIIPTNCGPVLTADKGLSFKGILFDQPFNRIARVLLILGNAPLSAANTDGVNGVDVVAMDDFIYGEPHAIEHHPSDFDGDGIPDLSVFRPSNGNWFVVNSGTNTVSSVHFGQDGDVPIDGDFDGDKRNDFAVFRPSSGTWFFLLSSDPNQFGAVNFGLEGDVPVPADYNHTGRTDIAVWRPSIGDYFIRNSVTGEVKETHWGLPGDIPLNGSSR
jgi:hypothetical protein